MHEEIRTKLGKTQAALVGAFAGTFQNQQVIFAQLMQSTPEYYGGTEGLKYYLHLSKELDATKRIYQILADRELEEIASEATSGVVFVADEANMSYSEGDRGPLSFRGQYIQVGSTVYNTDNFMTGYVEDDTAYMLFIKEED